jgi:hypothetical protein
VEAKTDAPGLRKQCMCAVETASGAVGILLFDECQLNVQPIPGCTLAHVRRRLCASSAALRATRCETRENCLTCRPDMGTLAAFALVFRWNLLLQ